MTSIGRLAFGLLLVVNHTAACAQATPTDGVTSADVRLECRIDGHEADLVPIAWLGESSDGTAALIQTQDHTVRFFDSACRPLGSVGRQGQGPGEFENPLRGGWIGDTLWVSDTNLRRVTLISPDRQIVRTLPPMVAARPEAANASQMLSYMLVVPYALYAGDTLLVLGLLPTGDQAAQAPSAGTLLRVSDGGVIQGPVLALPTEGNGSVELGAVPFHPQPEWTVSPDGNRIATLTFSNDNSGAPAFRVATFDALGEEVHARSMAYEPVDIPSSVADSAVAARAERSRLIEPTAALRAEMRRAIPATYPPAVDIIIGSDQSVWVRLRDTPEGNPYLVIGPAGTIMGRVLLPRASRLRAARPGTLWTIERDAMGVESAVKYSFQFR